MFSHKRGVLALFVVTLLALLATFPSIGQETTAELDGHVSDPSGLAVVNADVTVANKTTGFLRETKSNAAGDFSVTQIPPGAYTITVKMNGFATQVSSGVELNVGE